MEKIIKPCVMVMQLKKDMAYYLVIIKRLRTLVEKTEKKHEFTEKQK